MKNNYCELSQEAISTLPARFKGYLLSPFQHNLRGGYVQVPEDAFKEMIAIIAEYAVKEAAAVEQKLSHALDDPVEYIIQHVGSVPVPRDPSESTDVADSKN